MTNSNNETPALIVALGVTAAIVVGGLWWLRQSNLLGGASVPVIGTEQPAAEADSGQSSGQSSGAAAAPSAGSFAEVADVPSGRFAYGGSTTWAPIRGGVDPLIQAALPNFQLAYKDPSGQPAGSSAGIEMLIDGELDFAQSSRPLNSRDRQMAEQKGVTLQSIPIAIEAVAIATNPELSIPGLTLAQLKAIYTGQISNWRDVGGPDLAIVPISRGDVGGTVEFFKDTVLEGQAFAAAVKNASTTTDALRLVSSTPGAIYFASAPEVVGQCTVAPIPLGTDAQQLIPPYQEPYVSPQDCPTRRNQMNLSAFESQRYPLTRPLYVIIGTGGEAAGTAYTRLLQTEEGARLLQQAGFVPL